MGRKKYYCEYCDKSFNDDITTRMKHLSSFKHIELKKEHYNNFKDPAIVLQEESVKKPCSRFQNEGMCRFGSSCRYSHYIPEELEHLRKIVEFRSDENILPSFRDWFQQQCQDEDLSQAQLSYTVVRYPNHLPPSLKPFDIMTYLNADLMNWGN